MTKIGLDTSIVQCLRGNAEMATFEKAARTLPGVDLLDTNPDPS
jgi:hypothetical protein